KLSQQRGGGDCDSRDFRVGVAVGIDQRVVFHGASPSTGLANSAALFPQNVANVSFVWGRQADDPSQHLGWVVQLGGFEPPTSGSTDRRSNHLSYSCTRPAWRGGRKLGATPF